MWERLIENVSVSLEPYSVGCDKNDFILGALFVITCMLRVLERLNFHKDDEILITLISIFANNDQNNILSVRSSRNYLGFLHIKFFLQSNISFYCTSNRSLLLHNG